MFRAIAKLLSNHANTPPCFVPPDNSHIESVPEFRAHLLGLGLTEAEASAVLVQRTIAGMLFLHHKGYSWEQIDEMPATCWLTKPTREADYDVYRRLATSNYAMRRACGLA